MGLEEERQDLDRQWRKYSDDKTNHIAGMVLGAGGLVLLISPIGDPITKTLGAIGVCIGLYCLGRWWHFHMLCQDAIKRTAEIDRQLDAARRAIPQ